MSAGRPTLLGLPYDGASSFRRGAAAAPRAVREALASPSSNSWSEALLDVGAPDALADAGERCAATAHEVSALLGFRLTPEPN